MARVVIALGVVLLVITLVGWIGQQEATVRRRIWRWVTIVAITVALAVLVRQGFHWLAVAGAAALGILKRFAPMAFRLLTSAPQLWRRVSQARARSAGPRGSDAHSGANGSRGGSDGGGREEPGGSRHEERSAGRRRGGMSRQEALEVLGVQDNASREEVLAAYKNLIRKVHPDTPGGSNYLASKLNQAKETLVG